MTSNEEMGVVKKSQFTEEKMVTMLREADKTSVTEEASNAKRCVIKSIRSQAPDLSAACFLGDRCSLFLSRTPEQHRF